mgnify:CR=1 FL=1
MTLLSSIESAYPGALQTHGFDSDRIASIVEWTARACSSQSLSGRQAASLALLQDARYRMVMASTQSDWAEEMRCELGRSISDSLNELDAQTPIDLCRLLSCALVAGSDEQTLIQIASQLGCLQQANGAWETTGRTAAVLIAILKSWSLMSASVRATADLENMVYKSVLYLRSEFDPETSSWHKHFQTTARAVHAIGLYNSIFRQSTQEFFEVIQSNLGRMNSALTLRAARTEFQALVEDNTGQKAKLAESNQNAARLAAENQYRRGLVSRLHKRLTYVQSALVIIGSLFASLLLSLAVNYPFVLTGVVSEVGSALPLVAGAIISLFFAWWVNPKRPT